MNVVAPSQFRLDSLPFLSELLHVLTAADDAAVQLKCRYDPMSVAFV